MGQSLISSLLQELHCPPSTEQEISIRMAKLDYLAYRARWDPSVKEYLLKFLEKGLYPANSNRIRAILIAERVELIGRLAAKNWNSVREIIEFEKDDLVKDLALYEAYHGMLSERFEADEALDLLRSIKSDFSLGG